MSTKTQMSVNRVKNTHVNTNMTEKNKEEAFAWVVTILFLSVRKLRQSDV